MARPAPHNITIYRGDTFSETWTVEDADGNAVDLSAATAKFQIKSAIDGTTLVSLATGGSGITVNASGEVGLTIAAATTAALTFETAVYDLEIVNGGVTETLVAGIAVLQKDVST